MSAVWFAPGRLFMASRGRRASSRHAGLYANIRRALEYVGRQCMKRRMRLIVAVVTLSALASVAVAQRFRRGYDPPVDQPLRGEPREWTFARLAYDGAGYRGRSAFAVDYPGAEYHVSQAVERLTR